MAARAPRQSPSPSGLRPSCATSRASAAAIAVGIGSGSPPLERPGTGGGGGVPAAVEDADAPEAVEVKARAAVGPTSASAGVSRIWATGSKASTAPRCGALNTVRRGLTATSPKLGRGSGASRECRASLAGVAVWPSAATAFAPRTSTARAIPFARKRRSMFPVSRAHVSFHQPRTHHVCSLI